MPSVDRDAVPLISYAVATAVLLAWDVTYAGRIARLRRAPRPLATLSALCGLLVVPALFIDVATASIFGGSAIQSVSWLWPLTTLLFVAQAAYALSRRLVTPFLGVPLLAYDVLLAVVALTGWMLAMGGTAPTALLALSAAHASVLGTAMGRLALASPLALQAPLIVPAYPARWRLTRSVRALLAAVAAITTIATLVEVPRGWGAVQSYQAWAADRLSERPSGDFVIGIKILPTLGGMPSGLAARTNLPLIDTVDVDAVSVALRPGALTYAALDSLSRILEPLRRDSTLLVVSLLADDGDRTRAQREPSRYAQQRLAGVERVARALRPDVLLPAEPYGADARALGELPVDFWRRYLASATARVRTVNRRIRVGVAAAAYTASDSALYAWAASPGSPIDLVGFTVAPSFSGGAGVDARLRAAERWMHAASAASGARRPKEHWLLDVQGFPAVHGDASQERTMWHALSWATAHPEVVGLIAAEPGDYTTTTGLRAGSGRVRRAVGTLARAERALREAVTP